MTPFVRELTAAEAALKYDVLPDAYRADREQVVDTSPTAPLSECEMRAEIDRQMELAKWFGECIERDQASKNDWMEHHDRRELNECLERVTKLEQEIDALTMKHAAE